MEIGLLLVKEGEVEGISVSREERGKSKTLDLRVETLNVATMTGKPREFVDINAEKEGE